MAAKLQLNFKGHLIGVKNPKCCCTLNFRGGEESFGFKKLLELRFGHLFTFSSDQFRTVASLAKKIKLIAESLVCKEIAFSELKSGT